MHISEGILEPQILAAGAVVGAGLLVYSIWRLRNDEIPKISAFGALFFLASFIHIPIGPTSVHLIMSGLVGAFVARRAPAAIFSGLLLQGLLFGYGGLTTLGVNLTIIATPALIGWALFALSLRAKGAVQYALMFGVGFVSVACGAALLALTLALNGEGFVTAAQIALAAHVPIMIIEGLITTFALIFIRTVKPQLLREAQNG
jgi:cobalt/nickel transport system permease protein